MRIICEERISVVASYRRIKDLWSESHMVCEALDRKIGTEKIRRRFQLWRTRLVGFVCGDLVDVLMWGRGSVWLFISVSTDQLINEFRGAVRVLG